MTIEERLEQLEKEIKRYKVVASYVPYGGSGSGGSIDAYTKEEVDQMIESVSGDISDKMDKVNPTGTGAFSLNRRSPSNIGDYSTAEGHDCVASGANSHAEGNGTQATGNSSHAEGSTSKATGAFSHAEGGASCVAQGDFSHAEGGGCHAEGSSSHAEGYRCYSRADYSHSQGHECQSNKYAQMVFGAFNIPESFTTTLAKGFIEIVGNGDSNTPSNARTLDWDGNEWLQGYLTASAIRLRSTTSGSTKIFEITVDDNGTLTATEVV